MLYELHADKNGTHLSNPRVLNKEVTEHNELQSDLECSGTRDERYDPPGSSGY